MSSQGLILVLLVSFLFLKRTLEKVLRFKEIKIKELNDLQNSFQVQKIDSFLKLFFQSWFKLHEVICLYMGKMFRGSCFSFMRT